eukprot:COSAG01_NODE_45_length_32100_cov_28.037218_12_plen_42_part_00
MTALFVSTAAQVIHVSGSHARRRIGRLKELLTFQPTKKVVS